MKGLVGRIHCHRYTDNNCHRCTDNDEATDAQITIATDAQIKTICASVAKNHICASVAKTNHICASAAKTNPSVHLRVLQSYAPHQPHLFDLS